MSYRDLFSKYFIFYELQTEAIIMYIFLEFTEVMRSLGFHQQISMDNFHSPNFALVSEVLLWLALRFEPDTNLPREIETSEQRVYFILSIVEFFVRHIIFKTNILYKIK